MGKNRKVIERSPMERALGTHVWAYFSLWSADSRGRALSNSRVSLTFPDAGPFSSVSSEPRVGLQVPSCCVCLGLPEGGQGVQHRLWVWPGFVLLPHLTSQLTSFTRHFNSFEPQCSLLEMAPIQPSHDTQLHTDLQSGSTNTHAVM